MGVSGLSGQLCGGRRGGIDAGWEKSRGDESGAKHEDEDQEGGGK